MSYSDNRDFNLADSVKDVERESLQNEFARAVIGDGKAVGRFSDSGYRAIDGVRERN